MRCGALRAKPSYRRPARMLLAARLSSRTPWRCGAARANAKKLAADVCVWEFGQVDTEGVQRQYLGLRGICYVELSVECLSQEWS